MTKEDTPLPLLSEKPTPITFIHYDILVGSDGNSVQVLTEGITPTRNRVTKSDNGSTLYGQLLSRDAKIAHLQSLNELKYNEGFTEASRIAGAKIKSLENEVARLQGATNFETVPKEAYNRLEGLVQELVDALARTLDPTSFAMTQARLPITEHEYRRALQQANAALSSAKALDFEPKTTT